MMKRNTISAFLFAVLLTGAAALSEDDIFSEGTFDAAVAEGQAANEANRLLWLGGVTFVSSTTTTLPQSRWSYGSLSLFTGKGFAKATKPSLGSLFVSYNMTHALWASTEDPTLLAGYARASYNPTQPQFSLSELHLSFDVGKVVFLRLGNQLIDWGASAVWSPADFINRKTDPTASVDNRTGKAGLRVHVPWSGGNLFAFADASRSLSASGVPRDLAETGTLGLKADTTWAGWNLGVLGNFSKSAPSRVGLTAVGALAGFDLWSEAGAQLSSLGVDSWSVSLGGERSWGTDGEWTFRTEGYWNPQGQPDVALTPSVLAGFTPYYWGQAYLYGELLRKKLWGPDVTGSLSATGNLSDDSWTATASLRTAFQGVPPFSWYVQYNGGEALREFTLSSGGPAWILGLKSVIEF